MIRFKYRDGEKDVDYVTLSMQQQGMATAMKHNISKSLEFAQCPICKENFDITIALSVVENRSAWNTSFPCHTEFDKLVKSKIIL